MKAYAINKYSKEDKLQLVEVPKPDTKENEVLIQVHAASVLLHCSSEQAIFL